MFCTSPFQLDTLLLHGMGDQPDAALAQCVSTVSNTLCLVRCLSSVLTDFNGW